MRVFLGVTGASGAPYAARLLRALSESGCEVGLAASAAGVEVLATELYRDASLPRDEVLGRFTDGAANVTVYGVNDYKSPYASGSAKVDAYVICPCSMSTVGTLAAGAMANLIHRAASVALKEGRKLVLVPRETPLSFIHLNGLATLQQAGAVILFAAPGFYHGAETIDDLVDFVVARILDQLGLDNTLMKRWGESAAPAVPRRSRLPPGRARLRRLLTPLAALQPAARIPILFHRPPRRQRRPRNGRSLGG